MLGEACAGLERGQACSAHAPVHAHLGDGTVVGGFAARGTRSDAAPLQVLYAGAWQEEAQAWGITVLNLEANLPQSADGPGVIVLLAGEAEAINRLVEQQSLRIPPPLRTAALVDTRRYKQPSLLPEPVGEVAAGQLLQVDAWDATMQWLREVSGGEVSWIRAEDMARLGAMDDLPQLGLGAAFAWQDMSLRTATSLPACAEAEPFIAIELPVDFDANFTINGVDIQLGSMVTFQQVHPNALSMTVHRGRASTTFGQVVQQSESIVGVMSRREGELPSITQWSGALRASDVELARGERAQAALNSLARANGWRERSAYDMPEDITHIVERGDSLYGLTVRYDTNVHYIIAANGEEESLRLLVGAEILIPKPGSGFVWRGAEANKPSG